MDKEVVKEFAWFDNIIIGKLILIGYSTNLEFYFLLGSGLCLLGGHALILGKATIGYDLHYHRNKTLARFMGAMELLIGLNILFNPNIEL